MAGGESRSILLVLKSPLSSQTPSNASIPMPDLEPHQLHWRAEGKKGKAAVRLKQIILSQV